MRRPVSVKPFLSFFGSAQEFVETRISCLDWGVPHKQGMLWVEGVPEAKVFLAHYESVARRTHQFNS
jgi:hypothetical protein